MASWRARVVGRCWTALVVFGPIAVVVPPDFLYDVIVPVLREMYVPDLSSPGKLPDRWLLEIGTTIYGWMALCLLHFVYCKSECFKCE